MIAQKEPYDPVENLAIGTIIEVDGTHIVADLDTKINELSRVYGGEFYSIGQFGSIVKIHFGRKIIYAYVSRLRMKTDFENEQGRTVHKETDERVIEADLFGEGEWSYKADTNKWWLNFERGVATFPLPQQKLYLTPKQELKSIFSNQSQSTIEIGTHVSSAGTPCFAEMNELLGKHTAILGSTGSGKSGTVASILHRVLERGQDKNLPKWEPRIIILDPHNEYTSSFPLMKKYFAPEINLSLPYWLLSLDETIELILTKSERGASSRAEIIKKALFSVRKIKRNKENEGDRTQATLDEESDDVEVYADSPIPYKLSDFLDCVDQLIPRTSQKDATNGNYKKTEDQSKLEPFNYIKDKIKFLQADSQMRFMMNEFDNLEDPFPLIMSQFFGEGECIRIIDLSGIPNEIAGTVSAVIARILFNYKLWQTTDERVNSPVLLVCEEAHRYVPNQGEALYNAAQNAIRRIAKEGRKYGIGLFLVSQRPGEVEATVLSQCNSWIVHRITNEVDREHVRAILPDSLASLTKTLSGLRRREAIFVGQAAMIPSRIMIRELPKEQLPRSHDINFDKAWQNDPPSDEQIKAVAKRWRNQEKT